MNKKTKILFSYRLGNASCCTDGDDDGFLFEIYSDGTGIYNKYVVPKVTKRSRHFKVSCKTVSEINVIFDKYKHKISKLDKSIDNGSCDGDFSIFNFNGKIIDTLNIYENDIQSIANPVYYIKYHHVIMQENIIIKIFKEICSVLRKNHAIRLKLESVFIPLWLFIGGK